MSLSLRQITRTTFTVYDASEDLVGRVYKDAAGGWHAQRRHEAAWLAPTSGHRSRAKAVAHLAAEVAP